MIKANDPVRLLKGNGHTVEPQWPSSTDGSFTTTISNSFLNP